MFNKQNVIIGEVRGGGGVGVVKINTLVSNVKN